MSITFSAGTSARMLCTCWKTYRSRDPAEIVAYSDVGGNRTVGLGLTILSGSLVCRYFRSIGTCHEILADLIVLTACRPPLAGLGQAEYAGGMNSRQRTHAAINFQQPDRAPVDINLTLAAYEKLVHYLDVDFGERPAPSLAMEVMPPPDLLTSLGVDLISVRFGERVKWNGELPAHRRDAWGVEYRLVEQAAGAYYEAKTHPLADATLNDLQDYPWPDGPSQAGAEALSEYARALHEQTELAMVGRFGAPILETAASLLGMEQWYFRLASDPGFISVLLDRISEVATKTDLLGIDAAGQYLHIVKVSGEDLGTQNGLLYSPKMFRELLLPPLARRWRAVREKLAEVNPEAKIMLHCCGAVRSFIPDLMAAGVDILDPIQPLAVGMEPQLLYEEYGGRLVFHGGIDVQRLLPGSSPDEVANETQRYLDALHGAEGGYIVAPSHTVQADVPPENMLAMIAAVRDHASLPPKRKGVS